MRKEKLLIIVVGVFGIFLFIYLSFKELINKIKQFLPFGKTSGKNDDNYEHIPTPKHSEHSPLLGEQNYTRTVAPLVVVKENGVIKVKEMTQYGTLWKLEIKPKKKLGQKIKQKMGLDKSSLDAQRIGKFIYLTEKDAKKRKVWKLKYEAPKFKK